jgi:hypothetical protein
LDADPVRLSSTAHVFLFMAASEEKENRKPKRNTTKRKEEKGRKGNIKTKKKHKEDKGGKAKIPKHEN